MDWRTIPSLSALRAFEATARSGSFSAAARELNVTHAAVAQHVRSLEKELGETLAVRKGQVVEPTEEGRLLAAALTEGFGVIAEGVRDLADRQTTRALRISLTPSFAESWLMPRLSRFWERHPDVELSLNPTVDVLDLRRDGYDIAIRFGTGNWPGHHVERLTESPFAVVAAPSLAKGRTLTEMGDLTRYQWFTSRATAEQEVWGASIDVDFETVSCTDYPSNGLALAAVRAGYGLSVQAMTLVEDEVRDGRLVALHVGDAGGLGYHIVTRESGAHPSLKAFIRWLRQEARAEQAASV